MNNNCCIYMSKAVGSMIDDQVPILNDQYLMTNT